MIAAVRARCASPSSPASTSGDQLGFKLMRALARQPAGGVEFLGVGGEAMAAEGLKSLFPISDIAVMGILPVHRATADAARPHPARPPTAIVAARPDALVIIDSPDFTHRVARRVRARRCRDLPVVDYVSPSVWAWRPGRARRCAPMSIACSRCCRSSRTRISGSAARAASMSAIR